MCTRVKFTVAAGLVLAALGASHAFGAPLGGDDRESADRLKAAYIFNFLMIAEWPATGVVERDKPLILAVVGEGSTASAIRIALDGRIVQEHKLRVVTYPDASAWTTAGAQCHVLYVTPGAVPGWEAMRSAIANRAILTIADSAGFCTAGGMLNLFERDNRIRFEANPVAIGRAGMKIRAELLKLATIVHAEAVP